MANRTATFETTKGAIVAELAEADAPTTTANFIALAQKGFYDGLMFHRYEPGFVIQGGDPDGTGMGGSKKTIPLEVTPKLKHDAAGVLAMARSADPDSASSQFYFTLGPASFLDMNYAVFGRVISGLESLQQLRQGDKMTKVTISE